MSTLDEGKKRVMMVMDHVVTISSKKKKRRAVGTGKAGANDRTSHRRCLVQFEKAPKALGRVGGSITICHKAH
jgi:5-methylcytosine-specific restriction endonuclease McrA